MENEDDVPLAPPPPAELCRDVTADPFESNDDYLWMGGDPNKVDRSQAGVWSPGLPAQPKLPTPMSGSGPCAPPAAATIVPVAMPWLPHSTMALPLSALSSLQVAPVMAANVGGEASPPTLAAPLTAASAAAAAAAAAAGGPVEAFSRAAPSKGELPPPPQPRARVDARRAGTLEYEPVPDYQAHRIWWVLDSKKLASSDREAVSPSFKLTIGSQAVSFKLMIKPIGAGVGVASARGGSSFKKAKGKGFIQVRCLDVIEVEGDTGISFRLAVGARGEWFEEPFGPFQNKFSDKTVYPRQEHDFKEWDFQQHIDQESQTFDVCLEVLEGVTGVSDVSTGYR